MNRLKRINHDGKIETIYSDTNAKTITHFFELVVLQNKDFKEIKETTFTDGSRGASVTRKDGKIIQYKLEIQR